MNTQQRLKQIKGLVQQAQAMHKPVFIGADELQIFIESLDAVERERDELRKTLAATQDGAAEAINHSLNLQAEIERRDAAAGEAVGYGFQHKETGKFGSWLNPKSLAHDCDNYCAVPLYTAAQPAVLPDDYFSSLVSKARQSAEKAMIKFPQPNYVLLKVAEEAGEVVQAGVHYAEGRETWENLEGEVIQTIAMLFRLVTEGDQVNGVIPPAAPGGDDVKQG